MLSSSEPNIGYSYAFRYTMVDYHMHLDCSLIANSHGSTVVHTGMRNAEIT